MASGPAGASLQDGGGLLPRAPGQRAPCPLKGIHRWYGVIQMITVCN